MAIRIVPYSSKLESEFIASYNRSAEHVPDCYPVQSIHATAFRVTGLPYPQRDIASSTSKRHRLLLAVKPSGGVTGYCDYLLPEIDPKDKLVTARGIIRFLWYDPGYRVAGEALLDAVEEAFRNAGATHIKAFGPGIMPFHKNLSDRLVHIRALFTIHGYQHVGGELYLGWSNFARDALERLRSDAQMPAGVTVTVEEYYDNRDGAGKETPRPSTRLYAIASSGEKLGICETISANEYDGSKELAETCFVSWLGVPPDRDNLQPSGYSDRSSPVQGQGLGKSLLARSLLEMHARGYKHASISTDYTNHRGQLFYTNFGFTPTDWTHEFERELQLESKL